ncbi:hypothetical protein Tco_0058714 [Tanacetum coccineum]
MILLQDDPSIQGMIGSSSLAKILIKPSLIPSIPTLSPGLNGEIFSVYDPEHNGVKFRLGGEPRKMSLLELFATFCIGFFQISKGSGEKILIYRGMFVTRIARSFGLLTNKIWDALSIEPSPHPTTRAVEEEEEAEEEAEGEVANEGAGGSANLTW